MGNSSYDYSMRSTKTALYSSKSRSEIFSKTIHAQMDPRNIKIREARDSELHPLSYPVIYGLDQTGSMGVIPEKLIKTELPKLMEKVTENVKDVAICFLAIGDHDSDNYPFQIGQFESGNEELDNWLERSYLEGKGGGNGGESYMLSWFFASRIAQTDAWDKRKQKGVIITIGDEPVHETLHKSFLSHIGHGDETISTRKLLEETQKKWHVAHIHINHGSYSDKNLNLREMLGENFHVVDKIDDIVSVSAKIISNFYKIEQTKTSSNSQSIKTGDSVTADDPLSNLI